MLERLDYEVVEAVEQQLDVFIERRAREARDQGRVEEMWAESVRRDRQRRRRENCAAWYAHEMHMSELHAALSEEHRAKAEALNEGEAR
jgi:hypothetical protein